MSLLAYLLYQADLSSVLEAVQNADWLLLFVPFIMFFVGFCIAAFRWRLFLRLGGSSPPILTLMRISIMALFFNNFFPSTIGGDVVKAYESWKGGVSKTMAAATVVVDRMFGVTALALFAFFALLAMEVQFENHTSLLIAVTLFMVAIATAILLLFVTPRFVLKLIEWAKNSQIKLLAKLGQLTHDVQVAFHDQPWVMLKALGLSVLLQSNVIVAHLLVGLALEIPLDVLAYAVIVPVAIVTMMLPISINGIGVRETAFIFLFGQFGVALATALTFAWIMYGMTLLHGLIGGVLFLFYRRQMPTPSAQANA